MREPIRDRERLEISEITGLTIDEIADIKTI